MRNAYYSHKCILLLLIIFLFGNFACAFTDNLNIDTHNFYYYDVIVVGGTPAGIMAAIAAEREGKKVLLLERTDHIGGLPANGLGATDLATRGATGGLFIEFINRVHNHYITNYGENSQQVRDNAGGYLFEPSVAEMVLEEMLSEYPNVTLLRMRQFDADQQYITMSEKEIREISILNRNTQEREQYRGRVFIDATYEGDLAAAAGVPYHLGREGADEYNEPFAGRIYKQWGGAMGDGSTGLGDNAIQAYNYRMPLTTREDNMVPIPKPENYDRKEYVSMIEDVLTGRHTGVTMRDFNEQELAENERRRERGEPDHENIAAFHYFGVRGFIPGWEANIDQPVSRQEAEEWIEMAGVMKTVPYTASTTTRGELLQRLYDEIGEAGS